MSRVVASTTKFPARWARTDEGEGVGGCSYKSVGQSEASILV